MRTAIGALAALGVISLSTAAFAQGYSAGYRGGYALPAQSEKPADNIGNQGQFVIGAERITALSFDTLTTNYPASPLGTPGGTSTQKTTGIALLGNSVGMGGATQSSMPRLGFDYFVIDGLSLGMAVTYAHLSGKTEYTGQPTIDHGSQDVFLFAPRVGYALQFGDTFSLWPRAGITYTNGNISTPASSGNPSTSTSTHYVDLTLEPLVGISPFSHFVILGGPYFDIGLGGASKQSGSSPSVGKKATSLGVTFGIAAYI